MEFGKRSEYRVGLDGAIEPMTIKPIGLSELRSLLAEDPFTRANRRYLVTNEEGFRKIVTISYRVKTK